MTETTHAVDSLSAAATIAGDFSSVAADQIIGSILHTLPPLNIRHRSPSLDLLSWRRSIDLHTRVVCVYDPRLIYLCFLFCDLITPTPPQVLFILAKY